MLLERPLGRVEFEPRRRTRLPLPARHPLLVRPGTSQDLLATAGHDHDAPSQRTIHGRTHRIPRRQVYQVTASLTECFPYYHPALPNLPSSAHFYVILHSFTQSYQTLPSSLKFYVVLPSSVKIYHVLRSST